MDEERSKTDYIVQAYESIICKANEIVGRNVITILEKMLETKSYYSIPEDMFFVSDLYAIDYGLRGIEEQIDDHEMKMLDEKVVRIIKNLIDEFTKERRQWPPEDELLENTSSKEPRTMIPHLEEVKLVVQGIGTLASLIRVWQTARGNAEEVTPKQVEEALELKQPTLPDETLRQIVQVIPAPVIDAIRDIITDAIERFAEALRDPTNTEQAKMKEEEIAKVTICRELKRIKRLNSDELPEVFNEYWISFKCV